MTSPRLIVAPVGLQPAAVLTPLLCEPLKPQPGDVVLLLYTEQSEPGFIRIRDFLSTRLGAGVNMEAQKGENADQVDDATRARIATLAKGRAVDLLSNGATYRWHQQLIPFLRAEVPRFSLIVTRSSEGIQLDGHTAATVHSFPVADVGQADLMGFLELSLDGSKRRRLSSTRTGAHLDDVTEVHERSGQLFVAVDASAWRLARYREILNWQPLQRDLGLELRRLLLLRPQRSIRARARQDGVPFANDDHDVEQWRKEVRDGTAFGWPERRMHRESPAQRADGTATWDGPPLVVVMGPQPGATLHAVYAHRPRDLVLLYDPQQPVASRAAALLQRDPTLGCQQCRCLKVGRTRGADIAGLLEPYADQALDVNATPGDKMFQTALQLWALANPARRRLWYLQESRSHTQEPPDEEKLSSVGLQTWVTLHSPSPVLWHRSPLWTPENPPDASWCRISSSLLRWMTQAPMRAMSNLSRLWARNHPPRLDGGRLHVPGVGEIDLGTLPYEELRGPAFAPNEQAADRSNGRWFDWVAGCGLALAGVDEVAVGLKLAWGADTELVRDELDVVTAHRKQQALWSCKTRKDPDGDFLMNELLDARANADRLLGRRSLAVLVLPQLPTRTFPTAEAAGHGHWSVRGIGHIVDAHLIADPKRATQLAGSSR
jgi:hypothetical protein